MYNNTLPPRAILQHGTDAPSMRMADAAFSNKYQANCRELSLRASPHPALHNKHQSGEDKVKRQQEEGNLATRICTPPRSLQGTQSAQGMCMRMSNSPSNSNASNPSYGLNVPPSSPSTAHYSFIRIEGTASVKSRMIPEDRTPDANQEQQQQHSTFAIGTEEGEKNKGDDVDVVILERNTRTHNTCVSMESKGNTRRENSPTVVHTQGTLGQPTVVPSTIHPKTPSLSLYSRTGTEIYTDPEDLARNRKTSNKAPSPLASGNDDVESLTGISVSARIRTPAQSNDGSNITSGSHPSANSNTVRRVGSNATRRRAKNDMAPCTLGNPSLLKRQMELKRQASTVSKRTENNVSSYARVTIGTNASCPSHVSRVNSSSTNSIASSKHTNKHNNKNTKGGSLAYLRAVSAASLKSQRTTRAVSSRRASSAFSSEPMSSVHSYDDDYRIPLIGSLGGSLQGTGVYFTSPGPATVAASLVRPQIEEEGRHKNFRGRVPVFQAEEICVHKVAIHAHQRSSK